jgi:hypothetical protein
MRRILAIATALLLAASVEGRAAMVVACGQHLADLEIGELQADLVCGSGTVAAVQLGRRGELRLNGHTITVQNPTGNAVGCGKQRCTITGPGNLIGPGSGSALGSGVIGFTDTGGVLEMTDVDVSGFSSGVITQRRGRVVATDVTAHDNNVGLSAGSLRGANIVARNNLGGGIAVTRSVRGTNVTSEDNFTGIFARTIRLDGITVTGNQSDGISARQVRLMNGTVTGNGLATATPFDLITAKPPTLENVSCGTSQVADQPPGVSWGVCSGD